MNKKGISPLIATVLIIGFTVALAAIIISWGTRFVENVTETTETSTNIQMECSRLSFYIGNVDCASDKKLDSFEIISDSDFVIKGIIVRVTDASKTYTATNETFNLDAFTQKDVTWGDLSTDDVLNPQTIEVLAKIEIDGVTETCAARKEVKELPADHPCRS